MKHAATLQAFIGADPARMRVLAAVRALALPDCWVAAGLVRNAVWDCLHGRTVMPLSGQVLSDLPLVNLAGAAPAQSAGDIDVIWFDRQHASAADDAALEDRLRQAEHHLAWSVKNQARMHERNGDAPYCSAADAMRYWPETATAVGVRLGADNVIEVAAPLGLDDLFDLIVRPTERFQGAKLPLYQQRVRAKAWHHTWPLLRIENC